MWCAPCLCAYVVTAITDSCEMPLIFQGGRLVAIHIYDLNMHNMTKQKETVLAQLHELSLQRGKVLHR
jgi:hypothetical protein